jgi:HPt (histidine-containing phosphotransfer) domain-containing protein
MMDSIQSTSSGRGSNEAMLDREVLDEAADLGLDDLHELIDLYFEQLDKITALLDQAIAVEDTGQTEQLAHQLAGSSGACGAIGVMNALRELERCCREGRAQEAKPLLQTVVQHSAVSRNLLGEYLREHARDG